ncbi:L-glyceraldehyde 3-phosphate reductase [Erysipelotrichaceae bacterium MTC7]|nr:L-glyceraldehyde 3-phosphate reductase [Erysipelotrichaceae bacterium MTC7]
MQNINSDRYDHMQYNVCGNTGLKLPALSFGLWHNFGDHTPYETMVDLVMTAFNNGITHFDLANNYGPIPGRAEENFGKILRNELAGYCDELIISTKAGYTMWDGPYGDWGSRKYLIASLDQSLKRMGLDYVDIFYHHRMDPNTPLEETMGALHSIVQSGKALYVGLSNYDGPTLKKAVKILNELGTPCIINQNKYSIFVRDIETNGLKETAMKEGSGIISFSPLAQGLLTERYIHGIPEDSRVKTDARFLQETGVEEKLPQIKALHEIARKNDMTLAQMAIKWQFREPGVTTVLIGASKPSQIIENIKALDKPDLDEAIIKEIDAITKSNF